MAATPSNAALIIRCASESSSPSTTNAHERAQPWLSALNFTHHAPLRLRCDFFEHDFISSEEALHAVGHMLARQGGARYVANVLSRLQLRTRLLTGELSAPIRFADLSSVCFPVLQNLDRLHRASRVQSQRKRNELVFSHHFIDHEPAAGGDAPQLELSVANAHTGDVFDGLRLLIRQSAGVGLERRAGEHECLRLLDGKINCRPRGATWRHHGGRRQQQELRFHCLPLKYQPNFARTRYFSKSLS